MTTEGLFKSPLEFGFDLDQRFDGSFEQEIARGNKRARPFVAEALGHLLQVGHHNATALAKNDAVKQGNVGPHALQARQKSTAPAGSRARTRSSIASSTLRRSAAATSVIAVSGETL